MEEKDEKLFDKKEFKLKQQARKLEEKEKKAKEKAEIKAEKERIKNSFGRKVRNFFLTIILVIILLIVGFYFSKDYLTKKEKELANEKMQQTYQTVLGLIEDKNYKKAIELLKTINSDFSNYQEVSKKLKEVEQMYLNDYLLDADKYLKDKKYDKALSVLDKVEKELQNAEVIINKKSDIHIAKIQNKIKEFETDNEDIEGILKFLVDYNTNDLNNVKEEVDDLISEYKNKFILETRELMAKDFEKAKLNLEEVEKILPEDKDIKDLLEELNNKEPVSLLELSAGEREGKLSISKNPRNDIKATDGNSYVNYILVQNSKENSNTVTYNLDKEYSKLSGKICILQSSKDAEISGEPQVKIYNKDKVIYSSEKLTGTSKNIEFSVDVNDCDEIKIELIGDTKLNYFIADPTLTK